MAQISTFIAASVMFSAITSLVACSSSDDPAPGAAGASGAGAAGASGAGAAGASGGSGAAGTAGAAGTDSPPENGGASAAGAPATGVVQPGPKLDMASADCAISKSGAAYCWGFGANGETGAEVGSSPTPVQVQGGYTFTTISTYGAHTCALTSKGEAYCWGDGAFNALGDGITDGHLSKAPVRAAAPLTFAAITVGNNYTCALRDDGTAYCWGTNLQGTLGIGTADSTKRTTPTEIPSLKWQSISARDDSVCGVTTAGDAYCWGTNAGVNGTGGPSAETVAAPKAVPGGVSLKVVVTASADHACGLSTDGHAYCWGNATIGDGTPGGLTALGETAVTGGHVFTRIAAARNAFCAVTPDGETYCWGPPFGTTPAPSFEGIVASEVATRGFATCVIATMGTVYCLGSNALGALGDGSNMDHAKAAPVAGEITF